MKKYLLVSVCFIVIFFLSCEKDTTTPDDNYPVQMGLNGVVQKGPFITGSSIQIQELNANLSPNGISYNVSTEDNFGSFTLESEVGTDFIEIISTGFYYNEVSGEVTNTNLSLRAFSPVLDSLNCNINILTTLAKKRIVYLINEEDKTYIEAKQQAQNEILKIFSIYEADIEDFDKMDISKSGKSDAILLAISVVLQGSNSVSELSLLISTIIEDVKEDGILDDSAVKLAIYNNAKILNLPEVRTNIQTRYQNLGLTLTVPDFEKYVIDMWKKQCTIVSPLNNENFNYNDSLTVTIDDFASYINIINTKFYFDGILISEDNDYPFSAGRKLQNLDFGSHLLKAVAIDDSSNVYADSINIIVNTPPEFKLSAPSNNSSYNLMDSIYMNISSQPDYLDVTNVKYYFDDELLADIDQAPFNNILVPDSIVDCGNRFIKAEITDETGRITRDSVNVIINTPSLFVINSPMNNSSFNLKDSIYINISSQPDYLEVTNVKYYFDDELLADIDHAPFENIFVPDSIVDCGNRYIKAEITDETGRVTRDSVNINIIMPDEFTLISPAANSAFSKNDSIEINISTHPDFISVTNVKYYFNSTLIADISDYPFEYSYVLSDSTGVVKNNIISIIEDQTGRTSVDSVLINIIGDPEMLPIPGGTFYMGGLTIGGPTELYPAHYVTLSDFSIGKFETTQSEWETYMPVSNLDYGRGDIFPVYNVSWYEIIKYCNLRSIAEGFTPCYSINSFTDPIDWGNVPTESDSTWNAVTCNWNENGYRLPTEAEWEYAARGGITDGVYPNGMSISHSSNGDTQANYNSTSWEYLNDISPTSGYHPDYNGTTSPVGVFNANGFGLYDMSGNVSEACWDWWYYYTSDSQTNPTGSVEPTAGPNRIARGGSWYGNAFGCWVASRGYESPNIKNDKKGFRVVRRP